MVRKYCTLTIFALTLPLYAQTVSINPTTVTLKLDTTRQFAASVTGATNTTVTWSVNGVNGGNSTNGTITVGGLYTPPATLPANPAIKVRATSNANNTKFAEATVSLQNPTPTITDVAPTEFNIGDHNIVIKGTKFMPGARIKVQNNPVATTYISTTEVRATVSLPNVQQYCFIVENVTPGGGNSNSKCYNVMANVSVTVSPTTVTLRGGATRLFTVAVRNTSDRTVDWSVNGVVGGNATTGTITTDGTYTAPLAIAAVGGSVKVGARSRKDPRALGESTVTLQNPVPTISGVSPATIPIGAATFTITGNGFAPGATVNLGGVAMSANVMSLTQISVTGTTKPAPGGIAGLTVSNIAPGASTSAPRIVTLAPANARVSYNAAKRFLEQASWGATPAEINRVMQMGFDAWLDEQKSLNESTYTMPTPNGDIPVYDMQAEFFNNAMNRRDQLRQRVAFSLHKLLVVSAVEVDTTHALVPYHRILLRHALGNYGELMKDITLDVAMGEYLDMVNNDKANPTKGTEPNENYAREVMQLFTLGTAFLRVDGTPLRDSMGNPYPAYREVDILELSRAFTGWTYPPGKGRGANNHNNENYGMPMVPVESNHDTGAKNVLGITIPAGQTAMQDVDSALRILFEHPNIAPFVCLRLIQNHTTSNPSPGYLLRCTTAFNNYNGKRGDLFGVMRAILLDPEARAGDSPSTPNPYASYAGHLLEPVLFFMHMIKALDGTIILDNPIESDLENMGQKVFYPPSVFSYHSPLTRVPGTTAYYGPEFQNLTPVTALERVNYVDYLLKNNANAEAKPDLAPYIALAGDTEALILAINNHFLHGAMPEVMKQGIRDTIATTTDPARKARLALYLALSSSHYQIQN